MKNKKPFPWNRLWIYIGISLIAILPLLNIPPWFAPPDWGKIMVFQWILAIFGVVWMAQKTFFAPLAPQNIPRFSWKKYIANPPVLFLLVFLVVFLAATIWSANPAFSFWGTPYRSGGFLNLASFAAFALLAGLFIREQEWNVMWIVSFVTAFFVGIIAIFQQYSIMDWILIPSASRPPSTVGGSIFLGIYLMLNALMAIAFGCQKNSKKLRMLYFSLAAFALFVAVVIALSRAAMLGAFIGLVWFFIGYPNKKRWVTIASASALAFGVGALALFFVKPGLIPSKPVLIRETIYRIISIPKGEAARQSAWAISWQAFKEKPLLGYGSENFAVGFDKFYDPSLPQIAKDPEQSSSWWDRGHNIVIDLGLQAGILGIGAFLLFFGSLWWTAQKIKANPEHRIAAHGMQAALAAYLTANLFSFDTFSVYFMLFMIAGYALFLREAGPQSPNQQDQPFQQLYRARQNAPASSPVLKTAFALSVILLAWFFWKARILPFRANTNINLAMYYAEHQRCEQAMRKIEQALAVKGTFLDAYTGLKYTDVAAKCEESLAEKNTELVQKAYELMKQNVLVWPTYTRNWMFLGRFATAMADKAMAKIIPDTSEQKIQELVSEANFAFEQAHARSPKRQEVYVDWVKVFLTKQDYRGAKQKAEECLVLNPEFGECLWMKGLAEIYLGEQTRFEKDRITASERGYNVYSMISLSQLVAAYTKRNDKAHLTDTYEKLAQTRPNNVQVLGTLAWLYRDLKQYDKARETALKVAQLNPEAQEEVSLFLQALR